MLGIVGAYFGGVVAIIIVIIIALMLAILFDLIITTHGILTAALYLYATTGEVTIIPWNLLGVEPKTTVPYVIHETPSAPLKTAFSYNHTAEAKEQKLQYLRYQEDVTKSTEAPKGFIKCPTCGTINPINKKQCICCAEYLEEPIS